MVSAKKNSSGVIWPAFIAAVLTLSFAGIAISAEEYTVSNLKDGTAITLAEEYAFDVIKLPTRSEELWGQSNECRAAMLEIGGQQFISSAIPESTHLVFKPEGLTGASFTIRPLIVEKCDETTSGTAGITFTAVPARVRAIETSISTLTGKVSAFQSKNHCFSCHTALPLAIVYREANSRGFNIDQNLILSIGRDISAMQLGDGSFFFDWQPVYGRITTTMCAGAVLAIISDYSTEFLMNMRKILPLLHEWNNSPDPVNADFFLQPVYTGQPTSALFEALIISTLYFKSAIEQMGEAEEMLRLRLLDLKKWASGMRSEPIYRRIVIMMGIPVLFQISPAEQTTAKEELLGILTHEPEGRRLDVRAMALLCLTKMLPDGNIELSAPEKPQNLGDEIWQCLENIIQVRTVSGKKAAVFSK